MGMLAIDEIADFLEDDAGITVANRMEAVRDQLLEEFRRIGEVEVSGHRDGA